MELFKCSNFEVIELKRIGEIETPLGAILLDLHVDNETIFNNNSSKLYKLATGGYVSELVTDICRAELLVCRPKISIPPHMSVDDCWAGIWRVQAFSELNKCYFSSIWENGYSWTEGGPNDGENLVCKIWTDSKMNVAMGTEDGERLITRAKKGDYLPERLEKEIDPYDTVRQLSTGLEVPIERLKKNEIIQIHFIVAWAKEELPTWFAVDMTSEEILESQMCI